MSAVTLYQVLLTLALVVIFALCSHPELLKHRLTRFFLSFVLAGYVSLILLTVLAEACNGWILLFVYTLGVLDGLVSAAVYAAPDTPLDTEAPPAYRANTPV